MTAGLTGESHTARRSFTTTPSAAGTATCVITDSLGLEAELAAGIPEGSREAAQRVESVWRGLRLFAAESGQRA